MMAVFRVHKNKDYTTMSNYHLKDNNLSLKAKGLLSLMLSLPDDWDYSVRGLESICVETKDTINGILKELENNNYLERKRVYCNGKISNWEYNIYENNLHPKNQDIENQDIENYDINKILNNKKLNNKENINTKEKFKKPTLEEITQYCNDRNNDIDPEQFYDFYESKNWMIGKNKMRDYRAAVRTWERNHKKEHKETRYEREKRLLEEMCKDE
jgi:tRNA nucleotidyltransferase/poly(A) polymerase